jgi:iron complex transport system ATP-binding protein
MSLLTANVSFGYGETLVLDGVSVELRAGELVALLGPNGSGKSTLIKVLVGHLAGAVSWEGKELHRWSRRELARRVAYLPQSPAWDPEQRVIDGLRLGRAPYWSAFGIESSRDVEVVEGVSRELALTDLLHRRMDQISGGQRQRVFLGRCLVQEPRAMLLDEPNTFLDLRHQVELATLLKRLAKERDIGIFMASHDLNLAARMAGRMYLLDQGHVAAQGTAEEVLKPDVLERVYGVRMRRLEQGGQWVVVPEV